MGNLICEHGGNIYEVKRRYKREVIDFSANINPLGLPPKIKSRLWKNFQNILHYPDIKAESLIKRIAKYWPIKEENILVGNGSIDLLYLLIYTFKPRKVCIPFPTFSEYERTARCVEAKVNFLKLEEDKGFKFQGLKSMDAEVLFLCNPNNPTGNLIFEEREFIEKLPIELVIIDEAFMDFLPDEKKYTLIWKAQKSKKIIVLRTFTKFFALAGLRLGYLVAQKDTIDELKKRQVPWCVNSFAQLAGESILDEKEYIEKTRQFIERERRFLFTELTKIEGLKPYPSVTNFLLVKIEKKKLTSSLLKRKLIQEGILIRDCSNFRGLNNKFIRTAVRRHRENLKLIEALKKVV
ncbi:MAG: threonine-phosphate decarboxylase [Candidatus Omnitrophica bacterium 4484_70.1]|nr:MAG: threonine-phosphate decarboxylase [Candidatus Omnitrophica bacterium 4484_70.1]